MRAGVVHRWACGVLATAVLGSTGCAGHGAEHVGAASDRPAAGPSATGTPQLPPLVARAPISDDAPAAVERDVQGLSGRIDEALARGGNATPSTRLESKAAAGDQLIVRWTTGGRWPDPQAPRRVRIDAVTILRVVRSSNARYGSVLLLATGPTTMDGKRTESVVVRAKYTHTLVRNTDWSRVSPDEVLGMCDDKPAVIAVGYR